MVILLPEPTSIFVFVPSNLTSPPSDIDLCADDICKSPLFASNSKLSVFISTPLSNMIYSVALFTNSACGFVASIPINIPAVPLPSSPKSVLLPIEIKLSVLPP